VDELRPDDIVGYRFKQALRGYAVDEVDQVLDRVADQIERMTDELEELRGRLEVAETQAAVTRETEATLQRTLVVAQQAAERNLADADAQAEATLAQATADAERIRREAAEAAARSRSEAEQDAAQLRADAEERAARTLEEAQEAARREVLAARARVQDAADRHAEVVRRVAQHREALRHELANLEELALDPPPQPRSELVAGELPTAGEVGVRSTDLTGHEGSDPGGEGRVVELPEPPAPLRIRVHEGRGEGTSDEAAPLGSARHDGD
jgi:cell division initiation protein